MRIKTVIINDDGEVISDKEKHCSDILNDDGYRFPYNKAGASLFSDVLFPKEMTDAEIGKMTRLSKLMIGKTNMLGYRKNRRIMAYTAQEIANIVGMCDRRGINFVSKMVRLRVIQRVNINGDNQYYINPAYFMACGQRLSLDLFLLFRNELLPLLPKWVINSFIMQAQEKKV